MQSLVRLCQVLSVLGLLAACGGRPQRVDILPAAPGATYELRLDTYSEPDTVAQPFTLLIGDRGSNVFRFVLSVEQCRNIDAAQMKDKVIIFYDQLVVDGFSGGDIDFKSTKFLLCENGLSICIDAKRDFISHGGSLVPICTAGNAEPRRILK